MVSQSLALSVIFAIAAGLVSTLSAVVVTYPAHIDRQANEDEEEEEDTKREEKKDAGEEDFLPDGDEQHQKKGRVSKTLW
jgi:hypothetical protein